MRIRWVASLAAVGFWVAVGLGSAVARRQPPPSKFRVMTPAFSDGGKIPTRLSCADPKAASPALEWSNPPAGTKSFALIFHDVDFAPGKGSMDVTHWIFWDVPAGTMSVPAGVEPGASPDGMRQGENTHKIAGYLPVCPPPGALPHHYIIELFALDTDLNLPAGSTRTELLDAMNGHVLGKAGYVGRFGR